MHKKLVKSMYIAYIFCLLLT